MKRADTIYINMDGGIIQGVFCLGEPVRVVVIDYDVEGMANEDLSVIPWPDDPDGLRDPVYIFQPCVDQVLQEDIDAIEAAIAQKGGS